MSEDQNDSPAFRLRPRRGAPKSYYTVRLEYSANPAAFVRERPRDLAKKRIFSQKTGSSSTKSGSNQRVASGAPQANEKPTVVTKEELEQEERRLLQYRQIGNSITTNTMISPFMQRLQLDELDCNAVYEHNYITLKIIEVKEYYKGQLLLCYAKNADSICPDHYVNVRLHNEYANSELVKPGKILSIAKFRTGIPDTSVDTSESDSTIVSSPINKRGTGSRASTSSNGSTSNLRSNTRSTTPVQEYELYDSSRVSGSLKIESTSDHSKLISKSSTSTTEQQIYSHHQLSEQLHQERPTSGMSSKSETITLPFNVIVKYDELVERSTSNSNRGSSLLASSTSSLAGFGGASVNRRPLIPFISITDMIEQPTEPFVEMSPPSPDMQSTQVMNMNHDDHENNQGSKKVKFTASKPD